MNNKSHKTNKRLWTQIAEDIGFVLRKDIIDKRRFNASLHQRKQSTSKLIHTLIKTNTNIKPFNNTSNKKIFISAPSPKTSPSSPQKHLSSHIDRLKSLRRLYELQNDFVGQSSVKGRQQELREEKRRQAEMMRAYLHKIKVQSNVNHFYHYRQKCYKVWKSKVNNKRNWTLQNLSQ